MGKTCFAFGCIFGGLFGMVFVFSIVSSPWSIASKAHEAIAECEKELPRTQKCEVSAIAIKEPTE